MMTPEQTDARTLISEFFDFVLKNDGTISNEYENETQVGTSVLGADLAYLFANISSDTRNMLVCRPSNSLRIFCEEHRDNPLVKHIVENYLNCVTYE